MAFNNAGTLTCDLGSNSDSFGIGLPFSNSGSVVVQQGTLCLDGTGSTVSSGTFTGARGTSLTLNGQDLTPAR